MPAQPHTPQPGSAPQPRELRHFGLVLGGLFAGVFGALLPLLFGQGWPLWAWLLAGTLAALALAWPRGLQPLYRLWLRFGSVMAVINSWLLLGVVFFLLITPIALLLRLLRVDLLRLRPPPTDAQSLLEPSNPRERDHMSKPY